MTGRRLLSGPLVLLVSLVACSVRLPDEIVREVRGDTVSVTIPAGYDTAAIRVDSVEVLWQNPALDRPHTMALAGRRLVIGDQTQVHILDLTDLTVVSTGRRGQGPGEFRRVRGLAADADRIVVFDDFNSRLSVLDPSGSFLSMRPIEWPPSFRNVRPTGPPYRLHGEGFLTLSDGPASLDEAPLTGLVWQPIALGEPEVLRTWSGVPFVEARGYWAPAEAFPPQVLVTASRDGRVAEGDGLQYCVRVTDLAGPEVLNVCRSRPRAPITRGVRRVPDGLDLPPEWAAAIRELAGIQSFAEYFPSFDRLLFAETGELWVRALGEDAPDVHPFVAEEVLDLWPPYRRWESLEPDGSPGTRVLLPRRFDPEVFDGQAAYGLLELNTGELVVARTRWDAF
jgi:hypothetical protein